MTVDGTQFLYGKWEDFSASLRPTLDACGGHYGFTPESPKTAVYHYHVQDTSPFTIGCYGPNANNTVVTTEQCEALYPGCGSSGATASVTTAEEGTYNYRLWCPCRFMGCSAGQYAIAGTKTCKECPSGKTSSAGAAVCSSTNTTSAPPTTPTTPSIPVTAALVTSSAGVSTSISSFGDNLASGTYSVSLSKMPSASVTVTLTSSGLYTTVSPAKMIFDGGNWSKKIYVQVNSTAATQLRPACAGGARTCDLLTARKDSITHTFASSDATYSALAGVLVAVNVGVVTDSTDPPKLLSAKLGNELNSLTLTFDSATDRANMNGKLDCSKLLVAQGSTPISSLLGVNSYCSFSSPTTLQVVFGSGAKLAVGDLIGVQTGVLKAAQMDKMSAFVSSLFSTSDAVAVGAPTSSAKPAVELFATSKLIGICDNVTLGSSTSGSGGRNVAIEFTVTAAAGVDISKITAALAAAKAKNGGQGSSTVTLTASDIPAGSEFDVTVKATTFLGTSANSTIHLKKLTDPAPSLTIEGGASISGSKSRALTLRANAEPPSVSCAAATGRAALVDNKMTYAWTETTNQFTGNLTGTSKNPRELVIPAGVLEAGKNYTFKVTGIMTGTTAKYSNTAEVVVVVAAQPLVATIQGGAKREVGDSDSFNVNASDSRDPDDASGALQYRWTCSEPAGSTACSAYVSTKTDGGLVIPAGALPAGNYSFTVTTTKGTGASLRSSTATTNVTVKAGTLPVVNITGVDEKKKYNSNDKFLELTGKWSVSSSRTIISAVWTAMDSDVPQGVFSKRGNPATTVADESKVLVSLRALTEGATYTLRLTATDTTGATSFAETMLLMNKSPSSGSLAVTPATGFAMEKMFIFSAANWVDEDLPMTYAFGVAPLASDGATVKDATATLEPFGSAGRDSTLTNVALPQGDAPSFLVGLYVKVADTYGSFAVSTATATVNIKACQTLESSEQR